MGGVGIKPAFPRPYGIATDMEASIESSLTRLGAGERRSWDVRLFQDLNDWKLGTGDDFLRPLDSNIPSTDIGVRMRWKLTPNGDFDSRSFYNKL